MTAKGGDRGSVSIQMTLLFPTVIILTLVLLQMGLYVAASMVTRSTAARVVTLRSHGVPLEDAMADAQTFLVGSGVIGEFEWCESGVSWDGRPCTPVTGSDDTRATATLRTRPIRVVPGRWYVYASDAGRMYGERQTPGTTIP